MCSAYGKYYQRLQKDMQTKLAAANVVADETLASVTTVRAHAAARGCAAAYRAELLQYYHLSVRAAVAYGVYVSINTCLPQARPCSALCVGCVVALPLRYPHAV